MIFCVEDDDSIRELMVYALMSSGFQATGFADGPSFWQAMEDARPELILLDIMLPGEDGISILRRLRADAHTETLPVIMSTAKGAEYDKVLGLDSGADDYLVKPFGMMEMVSRVKAVLRRSLPREQTPLLRCGDITVDRARHLVTVQGTAVSLTLKEFELLCLFVENPGLVFTRDQLLRSVWGADFLGESRTVDVHIGTLRTKLGQAGKCIGTVRGVGYKMEPQS
ncbi:MAG: winged helix-turn-helix domain-containing protein [Candidatus Limivicinus sp.]